MVEQPAEQAPAEQGVEQPAELDLTNAHLPSLADVPGLTQQLTVSAEQRRSGAGAGGSCGCPLGACVLEARQRSRLHPLLSSLC